MQKKEKTLVSRKAFMSKTQPLFEIDVAYRHFKPREKEVEDLIYQYYWTPIDAKVLEEIKQKVEKLLFREIQIQKRTEKIKKINDSQR